MAYIVTADFLDIDIQNIVSAKQQYITNAELWFKNFVTNSGGTIPVEGEETENQKRLIVVIASERVCKDNVGMSYMEVQGGLIDKYAVKFETYYNERTGEKIGQFGAVENSLEDIVKDELVGGTGTGGVTLDFNM